MISNMIDFPDFFSSSDRMGVCSLGANWSFAEEK